MSKDIADINKMKDELRGILGRSEEEAAAPPPKQKPMRSDDEIIVPFRCAVTGKPFIVVYCKNNGLSFTIRRVEKVEVTGEGGEATPPETYAIDIDKFPDKGWHCPWCHKAGWDKPFTFIQCGRCREYVCGGRSTKVPDGDDIYRCHDGCGAKGRLTGFIEELNTIKDEAPSKAPARHEASRKPTGHSTKSIADKTSLRLGRKK